jgi:hypothetical protein
MDVKILTLEENSKPHSVEVKALLGDTEFQQLLGRLDNLAVFATEAIDEPATAIKTGARHSFAKYLLFPVKLRRQFKTDGYDFSKLSCGVMKYRDTLFVIYGVQKKATEDVASKEQETDRSSLEF